MQITKILIYPLFLMQITLSGIALSDIYEGGELHQESCLACHIIKHDADFYERKDRKIEDHFALRARVSFCVNNLDISWFPDEEMSVIEFLNQTYYHFPKSENSTLEK